MLYLWVKTAHIFAIVAWMAGLLYLPRLFVYHSATTEPEFRTRFTEYEGLLYRRIMRPAMIATLVLGFWLLHLGWAGFGSSGWIVPQRDPQATAAALELLIGNPELRRRFARRGRRRGRRARRCPP